MAGLPGKAAAPKISKPKGKKQKADADSGEEGKIEELSFDEIRALEQEFVELTQGKVKKDLEAVRKKREEDELLGRTSKPTEQTDLSDIETAFTGGKQGGLPEHLANLPENHPLRARFEQGYRRRPDGTWFKTDPDAPSHARKKEVPLKKAAYLFPILLVLFTVLASLKMYNKALETKRTEIIAIIKKKGLDLEDPMIRSKYRRILVTNWLPDLERLRREIERIPRNFDSFPDNVEEGTYIDFIKKHDLPFDEMDAQEWYTRSIRKPAWNK